MTRCLGNDQWDVVKNSIHSHELLEGCNADAGNYQVTVFTRKHLA